MGLAGRLGIVSLLLIISQTARGQGQLLLLDRSGSMQTYYQSGLIAELGQRLNDLMQNQKITPVRTGAFNNRVEIVPDVNSISASGPTYLDVAVDYAINNRYTIAWLITDNIMHRSGEEEGKTSAFYDRLKTDAVARVVVFPLKQEEGKGHAGIIVYALLLSNDAVDVFKTETEEFARLTSNTALLPMKPLDRDTIDTVFIENASPKKAPVYTDGSVVQESLRMRFKSKFDHLKIVDADITSPRVAPEFSKNSLLNFERGEVTINPKKITELGPRGETIQDYTVSVDLGRIRLKRDLKSLWQAAWRDPNEEISLDLAFSINVPKEKFQFTDDFLLNYSADTTEKAKAQGKIYDLGELPLLVAENKTSIDVPHKPKIHVHYPWWLVFISLGVPALAAVVAFGGGFYAWRAIRRAIKNRPQWTVEVQEPADGKGSVRDGWVSVTVDRAPVRIGRIKGTQFISTTGVTPKGSQGIKNGTIMNLVFRKKNYSLIFRCSSPADEPRRTAKEGRNKNGKRSQVKI